MVQVGQTAPDFQATNADLKEVSLSSFKGKKVILNIFPSLDTPTCAMSVRQFNAKASGMDNTVVLCLSMDLPFAQKRFCTTEGVRQCAAFVAFPQSGLCEGIRTLSGRRAAQGVGSQGCHSGG